MSSTLKNTRDLNNLHLYGPLTILCFFGFLLLVLIAFTRSLDQDEGIYQYAAWMVNQSFVPYRDFFYPQAPYFLYAHFWVGHSLFTPRLVSGVYGFGTLILVLQLCARTSLIPPKQLFVPILLLAFHSDFLAWIPVFKTYSWTILISILSVYLTCASRRPQPFCTGVCIGVLICSRLLYIFFPLCFFYYYLSRDSNRVRNVLMLSLGILIVSLPCIYIYYLSRDQFLFNLVGIHGVRSDAGFLGRFDQKLHCLNRLLTHPQSLLIYFAVLISILKGGLSPTHKLILGCYLTLVISSFLPSPTHYQYFICALPFIVLLASKNLIAFLGRFPKTIGRSIIMLYVFLGFYRYQAEVNTNTTPPDNLKIIEDIKDYIRQNTSTDETILSFYPGYAVWTERRVPRGLENNFAFVLSDKYADKVSNLKVANKSMVQEWITTKRYRLIVLGSVADDHSYSTESLAALIEQAGYVRGPGFATRKVYLLGKAESSSSRF